MALRRYEMMVILDPGAEDKSIPASLDKYLAVVAAQGGSIDNIDIWGRRRMAFDIKKKSEGIYAVVDFTASSATAQELDRQLGLNESVLRTKILRTDA
jgi:small subunit ribosomal protein S6